MSTGDGQASRFYLAVVRLWFTWPDRSISLKAAFFRLATLRYDVLRDRVYATEVGFPENAEGSGVRRRSRENANDLKPDPREHSAQHNRRRPVHARGAQRKPY